MAGQVDLTNRFIALREVLGNQIEAVQQASEARSGLMAQAINQRIDSASGLIDLSAQHFQQQLDQRMALTQDLVNLRCDEQAIALKAAFEAQQAAMQAAFQASEKAIDKAEVAAEKRFEGVNEFRAQLSDQATTFLTRNEYQTTYQALADKMEVGFKTFGERLDQEIRRSDEARSALELRLTSRLDLMTGRAVGTDTAGATQRDTLNTKLIGFSVIISIVVILVNVVVAALTHHL